MFLPSYFLRLRETHNALQLPVFLLLVTLPALSGISENLEQKNILQTIKQLIQNTVLEIHFQSLKYTVVFTQTFEQPSIPIQAIQGENSVLM